MEEVTLKVIGDTVLRIAAIITALILILKLYEKWVDGLRKPNRDDIEKLKADQIKQLALLERIEKMLAINNKATSNVLRERIEGKYDYYINKGEITANQKRNLLNEIDDYRALDFNGIAKNMKADIDRLPLSCGKNRKDEFYE